MTIDEYKAALEKHDWYYAFSDDGRVYRAGASEGQRLLGAAITGDLDWKRAYNEAYAKKFDTPSFVFPGQPYKAPFPEVA